MKFSLGILAMFFLGACAGPPESLVVKQFLLPDQEMGSFEDSMVRMEKSRRLRGAVSMEERQGRLGQYYTLLWSHPQGAGQGEVEIVFEYRQGASASRVKTMARKFPSSDTEGVAEFSVIGSQYFDGGRVLAWKATLSRGGKVVSSKRSYLWE